VGVSNDRITIGAFIFQSGPYAAIGVNGEEGMQAAFNEINDTGGVHGRKLFVKIYDEGSNNPSVTQASANRAKNEAFLWMVTEGNLLIPYAEQFKVPLMFATAQMKLGLAAHYSFPVYPYVELQARDLLPGFMLRQMNAASKTIGIIRDTAPAYAAARAAFKERAAALNLKVIAEESVEDFPASCANQVANMRAKDPDIVFLVAGPVASVCVFRDARAIQYRPEWAGVAVTWNINAVSTATAGYTDGLKIFGHIAAMDSRCGDAFRAAARKYYPDNPNVASDEYAYNAYAIAKRIAVSLQQAPRELTREGFVKVLEQTSGLEDGCTSPPTYGPRNRTGPQGVQLWIGRGTQFVTLDPKWHRAF
jgi:branched-chain amino acid transport system substrate-binding protein